MSTISHRLPFPKLADFMSIFRDGKSSAAYCELRQKNPTRVLAALKILQQDISGMNDLELYSMFIALRDCMLRSNAKVRHAALDALFELYRFFENKADFVPYIFLMGFDSVKDIKSAALRFMQDHGMHITSAKKELVQSLGAIGALAIRNVVSKSPETVLNSSRLAHLVFQATGFLLQRTELKETEYRELLQYLKLTVASFDFENPFFSQPVRYCLYSLLIQTHKLPRSPKIPLSVLFNEPDHHCMAKVGELVKLADFDTIDWNAIRKCPRLVEQFLDEFLNRADSFAIAESSSLDLSVESLARIVLHQYEANDHFDFENIGRHSGVWRLLPDEIVSKAIEHAHDTAIEDVVAYLDHFAAFADMKLSPLSSFDSSQIDALVQLVFEHAKPTDLGYIASEFGEILLRCIEQSSFVTEWYTASFAAVLPNLIEEAIRSDHKALQSLQAICEEHQEVFDQAVNEVFLADPLTVLHEFPSLVCDYAISTDSLDCIYNEYLNEIVDKPRILNLIAEHLKRTSTGTVVGRFCQHYGATCTLTKGQAFAFSFLTETSCMNCPLEDLAAFICEFTREMLPYLEIQYMHREPIPSILPDIITVGLKRPGLVVFSQNYHDKRLALLCTLSDYSADLTTLYPCHGLWNHTVDSLMSFIDEHLPTTSSLELYLVVSSPYIHEAIVPAIIKILSNTESFPDFSYARKLSPLLATIITGPLGSSFLADICIFPSIFGVGKAIDFTAIELPKSIVILKGLRNSLSQGRLSVLQHFDTAIVSLFSHASSHDSNRFTALATSFPNALNLWAQLQQDISPVRTLLSKISTALISKELESVRYHSFVDGTLTLDSTSVHCSYHPLGESFELSITYPPDYPIALPRIVMSSVGTERRTIQCKDELLNEIIRDRGLLNAILAWEYTISSVVTSYEPCSICMSLLDPSGNIPKCECYTCHKFCHKACIKQWMRLSLRRDCPLCRGAWKKPH